MCLKRNFLNRRSLGKALNEVFFTLPLRNIILRGLGSSLPMRRVREYVQSPLTLILGRVSPQITCYVNCGLSCPGFWGPSPRAQQDWAIRETGSAPWIQTSGGISQLPAPDPQLPSSSSELPAPSSLPAHSSQRPAPSSQFPAPTSQLPAHSSQLPAPSPKLPVPSSQLPALRCEARSGKH